MKKTPIYLMTILAFSLFSGGRAVALEGSFEYKSFKEKTQKVMRKQYLTIKELSGKKARYERKTETDDYIEEEVFTVNKAYDTLDWHFQKSNNDTDYEGKKKGKTVTVKGTLKGIDIDKEMELEDEKPLYFTPKLNLSGFVLSDKKETKFWVLRKSEATIHLMQAKKKGEETIIVDGKEIDVVRVLYQATGKGAKFYKRTYFFRKSDGLFVKKNKAVTGSRLIIELINEE